MCILAFFTQPPEHREYSKYQYFCGMSFLLHNLKPISYSVFKSDLCLETGPLQLLPCDPQHIPAKSRQRFRQDGKVTVWRFYIRAYIYSAASKWLGEFWSAGQLRELLSLIYLIIGIYSRLSPYIANRLSPAMPKCRLDLCWEIIGSNPSTAPRVAGMTSSAL